MFGRVLGTMEALGRVDDAILARCAALTEAFEDVDANLHRDESLWGALAELRDELHNLAGRIDSRTVHLA